MAGSKANRLPTVWDGLNKNNKLNVRNRALNRRVFNPASASIPLSPELPPAGATGNQSGNSLPTAGGTMIGQIAYYPKLISMTEEIIGKPASATSNVLDISVQLLQNSSRVILAGVGGGGTEQDLEFIRGAAHAGQYLNIQGIIGNIITIKDDASGNGSAGLNIRTQTGGDILLTDNGNMELVFDAIANQWAVIGVQSTQEPPQLLSGVLSVDQTTNIGVGNHIEFDTVGAITLGSLVLSTGVGQANGVISGLIAGRIYKIEYGIRVEGSTNAAALIVRSRINDTTNDGTAASALTVSSNSDESFIPTGFSFYLATADTDTIRLEQVAEQAITVIEADSTYIIISSESGGGSGSGGGASSLDQLLDVAINPNPPIANDILQFNTTSGQWENQSATAGGGLLVDLSNLQAGAVPLVDMSLNNFDLENVTDIRMNAAGTGKIDNVRHLDFFEVNHNIQSFGDRLELQVDSADRFSFLNGSNESTVINNSGIVTDKLKLKGTATVQATDYTITIDSNSDMAFGVPDLEEFHWYFDAVSTWTMTETSFRGDSLQADKNVTIFDSSNTNPIDGMIGVAGIDVIIGSGGNAVNVTDLFNSVGGQFEDTTFAIFDNLDNTKVAKFDAAAISTGNTRTYNFQDANGRIALLDGLQQNFTQNIGLGGNTLQSVGGIFTDAALADIGQNTNYFDDLFINQIFFFGDASLGYKIGGSVTDGFDFSVPFAREFDFFFGGQATPNWIIRQDVIDAQGGRIEDLEEVQYDGGGDPTGAGAVRRIGYQGNDGFANMPTGGQFEWYFNGQRESFLTSSEFRAPNISTEGAMLWLDAVGVPSTGVIIRNGADLFVSTTNGVKNMKDIGGGSGGGGTIESALWTDGETSQFDFFVWHSNSNNNGTVTGQNMPEDLMYWVPIFVGKEVSIFQIGARIQSSGGGSYNLAFGIYSNRTDGQNYPQTRIATANTFHAGAGFKKSQMGGQTLSAGLYWLAMVCTTNSSQTSDGYPTGSCHSVGWVEDGNDLDPLTGYISGQTSTTLPTTAPDEMPTILGSFSNTPAIYARFTPA